MSPASENDGNDIQRTIQDTFVIGSQQTRMQDAEYVVNQLVEVAARALSPGVNDPFTASTCVDFLAAALCRLAGRKIPSPYRMDSHGRLRVVAYPLTFADVADTAFRQIRQHGRNSVAVIIRMLDGLALVLKHARRPDDRESLLRHARLLKDCIDDWPAQADKDDALRHYQAIIDAGQAHEPNAD